MPPVIFYNKEMKTKQLRRKNEEMVSVHTAAEEGGDDRTEPADQHVRCCFPFIVMKHGRKGGCRDILSLPDVS